MLKRIFVLIIFLISSQILCGQILFYTTNLSVPLAVNFMKIDQDLIYSKNSNAVYINDHKNQFIAAPLLNIGAGIGADLSRVLIRAEVNLRSEITSYKVRYPIAPETDMEYIGDMNTLFVDIPVVFGATFLNSRKIRPYVELGGVYSYDLLVNSEYPNEKSSISETNLYDGLLYNNARSQFSGVGGVGIKWGLVYMTLKYQQRLTGLAEGCKSGFFSINVNWRMYKFNKSKKYIHFED